MSTSAKAVAAMTAISVGVLGALTACSSGPDPRPVADRIAAAFAKGDLTAAPLADPIGDQKQFQTVIGGMDDAAHQVTVTKLSTSGDNAAATLTWTWSVGSKPWTYTTSMNLTRANGVGSRPWIGVVSASTVAPGLSSDQFHTDVLQLVRTPAVRGNILDSAGDVLIGPRPVFEVGIDKTKVPAAAQAASATALAKVVSVDPVAYAATIQSAGPQAFVSAITYRSSDLTPALSARINAVAGAVQISATLPLAPSKGFAGGLLGSVGPATADLVKASKGRVFAGDQVGTSGLELRYDESLSGTPAAAVKAIGTHTVTLFQDPAVNGRDLRVNLNLGLQNLADSILAKVTPASALVAIQPSTGKILAISDGPGSNGYLDATIGQFPPGSTFKTVTSLALFREGLTPDSVVPCTPSIAVEGKVFTNDSLYPPSGLGQIPLRLALANSCNTAYISQTSRLKPGDLSDAAASLGFGVDTETGYGSYFGQVPAPTSQTNAAADMIGQGTVLASPLSLATVLASIVAGHTVTPGLIEGLAVPARTPAHPLSTQEVGYLREMLRGVVTTPTGTGAAFANLPGAPVLAKTGTAEFQNGNVTATHAWMMAAQGDLAVAVFVNVGQTGAGVAGPLLAQFLRGAHQ